MATVSVQTEIKDVMSGSYATHGGEEKCIRGFNGDI
jgi:hypothetical protein